jgi:ubiquinone/menaquinone biosynthesis C-methylase UbiE
LLQGAFQENTFDLVIDKGTIDAIVCSENFEEDVAATLNEVARVLKSGGQYLVWSFGEPVRRIFAKL